MLICRVEHKEGLHGPYQATNYCPAFIEILEKYDYQHKTHLSDNQFSDRKHPSPFDEPELKFIIHQNFTRMFIFGFESLDQLCDWFYSYPKDIITILKDFNYHIAVYDVDDITEQIPKTIKLSTTNIPIKSYYIGERQSIFIRSYATLVDSLEL